MPEPDLLPKGNADPLQPGLMGLALLHDLTSLREQLARSIARNNLELRSDQITATINRILFSLMLLRIAEDRHLLPEGSLAGLQDFRNDQQLSGALATYADALYPDDPPGSSQPPVSWQYPMMEDRVIQRVFEVFLSSGRRYDYGKMQTGEIALVLMQYLARTIRRSAAHQAIVVDTRETAVSGRTADVPLSLIGYMVGQALASARKNRSSREILPLRVFDPACGSGTVLIAVCRNLLENAGPNLTFEERREILLQSVHGLDINPHAVTVTRMLLFLELCNYPGARNGVGDFSGAAQSVLRGLRHTVICGNALVGPEIVTDESWMFCPARDRHLLKTFSYKDRFPEIVAGGGFDAIVCNPPEGALGQREWIQQYFQRRYSSYHPLVDRSAYFLERSLSLVLPGGVVSCIMSNRWLRGSGGSPLRSLLSARQVEELVDLPPLHPGSPGTGLCIIRVRASPPSREFYFVQAGAGFFEDPDTYAAACRFPVDHHLLDEGGWVFRDTRAESVLRKIGLHGTSLGDFVMGQVQAGIRIPADDPLAIGEALARDWMQRDPRCKPLLRRLVRGQGIGRYCVTTGKYYLLIPQGWTALHVKGTKQPWQWFRHRYPQIARYLRTVSEILKARAAADDLWWETSSDEFWQQSRKKILFPAQLENLKFLPDSGRSIGDETTTAIPSAGLYLPGILNSRLIAFVFDQSVRKPAPGRQVFSWDDIRTLPVYTPDFDRPEDRARHDRMEKLVQRRIDLETSCRATRAEPERQAFRKKILATDRQIDALVYELYGLTADEIAVVEEIAGRYHSPAS